MTKKINWYAITVTLLLGIAIVMLFMQRCTGTLSPAITSTKEQITKVVADTIAMNKQRDSFNLVVTNLNELNKQGFKSYLDLLNENSILANENSLLNIPIPDTCEKLNLAWQLKYNNYTSQTGQTLNAANTTISGLSNEISSQRKYLEAEKNNFNKMRNSWDTCISNAQKLEKINKELQPRHSISIAAIAQEQYINPYKFDAGAMLIYTNKRGSQIGVGILTNSRFQIQYTKRLFSF